MNYIQELENMIANTNEEQKVFRYQQWVKLLTFIAERRNRMAKDSEREVLAIYDYVSEKFGKAFIEDGSVSLEHTMSSIEDGWDWKNSYDQDYTERQQISIDVLLKEAEKYSHSYMEEEEMLEYYADDLARLAIVKEEMPRIKELFPTSHEIYLVCYVHFDNINEQIYTGRVYSYQGALGNLLYHLNSGGEGDSVSASFIRNDKVRYTFGMDKTDVDDYEVE